MKILIYANKTTYIAPIYSILSDNMQYIYTFPFRDGKLRYSAIFTNLTLNFSSAVIVEEFFLIKR